MKKIVLAGLLAGSLMASAEGMFIGFDVGNTTAKGNYDFTLPDYSYHESGTVEGDGGSQTLKIGFYLNKNNRIAVMYQNINVEDGDGSMYGLVYDYLLGDNELKPFIGVIVGQSVINDYEYDSYPIETQGNIFGFQIGLNYESNENFSLEVGYRLLNADVTDSTSGYGSTGVYKFETKIDSIKNWYFGANYKF